MKFEHEPSHLHTWRFPPLELKRNGAHLRSMLLKRHALVRSKEIARPVSWLSGIWIVLRSMSKTKKVALSALCLLLVVVGGAVSYGKITGRAVAEEFVEYIRGFNYTFKDLPKKTRVSMSKNFWQRLQERVHKSRTAKDLHWVGKQILETVHFEKDGRTNGKVVSQKLDLWEFTYEEPYAHGVIKMKTTLGYDKNQVPQYFAEMIVSERTPEQDKELQDLYKEFYDEALRASDRKEIPFKVEKKTFTPGQIAHQSQPELNESGSHFDYSPIVREEWSLVFKGANGEEWNMGLPVGQKVKKVLRYFSKKQGKIIDVWVCEGDRPCGLSGTPNKLEKAYLRVMFTMPLDVRRTMQTHATWIQSGDGEGGFKMAIVPRGTEKEYEESFQKIFPQWFKDLKVPHGYTYLLIDRYGMPHDILEILKREIPELHVEVQVHK